MENSETFKLNILSYFLEKAWYKTKTDSLFYTALNFIPRQQLLQSNICEWENFCWSIRGKRNLGN